MKTVIHIDYQLLQYFQAYTKMQQYHYNWMGFLQQNHLVIKDREGVTSEVVDMLSLNASVVLHKISLVYEIYVEQYSTDNDFEDNFESLTHIAQIKKVKVIQEIYLSRIAGISKTMTQIQIYCYWPHMYETIVKYIKGCIMSSTSKPCNRNIGLHMPLLVPLQPWGSMDLVQGQIEMVNRTEIHILLGNHSIHPKMWDKSVTYVQQVYNQALHFSVPRQALSQERFKLCHDKHHFQVNEQVWLYVIKVKMKLRELYSHLLSF